MRTKIHDLAIAGDDDELSEFLEGHEEQRKRINEVCAPPVTPDGVQHACTRLEMRP